MKFEAFLSEFVQQLLLYLLPILAAALASWLIVQVSKGLAELKSARPDVYQELMWVAKGVVQAAEQAGAAGLITDKKNYAINIAEKWLAAKGWHIDLDLIDAAVEQAVWDEINKYKVLPVSTLTEVSE
ncbi:hypothetical protein ADN00_18885 [Ornatilinea apprima]|uniref:Holin n=1 Tax=Ornatilinea apprima TaxID=1134406 RepID=A0A0P6XGA0_9CHLR|nr:phage holin, LLH family [Ornatilinea apprima]KPL70109.1 hypothetical protein ADN00_18885 [Ornatilinea apprima]